MLIPSHNNPYKLYQCTKKRECWQWEVDYWNEILETLNKYNCSQDIIDAATKQLQKCSKELETAVNRPERFEGEEICIHYRQIAGIEEDLIPDP